MILIVSPQKDVHAQCVAQELAKLGASYSVVDSSRLTLDGRVSISAGRCSGISWTDVEGSPVTLEDMRAVWHRRRFMPALPVLADQRDERFLRREWEEFFSGVFSSLDCTFINHPIAQQTAVKPLQLRCAQQLGIRFPDTLITNDPSQVREFLERHEGRVIHKTLSPPRHRWLGTERWNDEDHVHLDGLVHAPSIFQEMVTDCRELRVTVIGEEVFAAEFRPRDGLIDGRLEPFSGYRKHILPETICQKLRSLTASLGLIFCTIDMKLTHEGEYVFLELNPQGQFLYIEILTDMALCRTLAELLMKSARDH